MLWRCTFRVGARARGGGRYRFVRKNPGLLLTTLGFLRDEPGLLDFENKRNLLRTLLANPDLATRAALDVMASVSAAPGWKRGGVFLET